MAAPYLEEPLYAFWKNEGAGEDSTLKGAQEKAGEFSGLALSRLVYVCIYIYVYILGVPHTV